MQLNNIQLPQTSQQPLMFISAQEQQHLQQHQNLNGPPQPRPGKKIKAETPPASPYSLLPPQMENIHLNWAQHPGVAPHHAMDPSPNLLPYDPSHILTLSPPSLSPPHSELPSGIPAEQLLFDHEQGSPVSYSNSADFGTVTDNDLLSIMAYME